MSKTTTVVRDLNIYYAKLDKPVEHPYSKAMVYDIQLRFPKDRVEEMSKFGKVRQVEDGNYAINVTRNSVNAKKEKQTVRVVDTLKQPIKDLIGNGSTGNVILYSYPWSVGDKSGVKTIVIAVQVTNLIKYEPEGVDFDIVEGDKKTTATSVDF